jgi:hypothetical protein
MRSSRPVRCMVEGIVILRVETRDRYAERFAYSNPSSRRLLEFAVEFELKRRDCLNYEKDLRNGDNRNLHIHPLG